MGGEWRFGGGVEVVKGAVEVRRLCGDSEGAKKGFVGRRGSACLYADTVVLVLVREC